jgi:hypothetical protein
METSKAESPDQAVAALNWLIALTQERGLHESAQFLAMAKTQLLIEINGISDVEFQAFCDWLDGKRPQPDARRGSRSRTRRDGQLRGTGRAWLCPEDAPHRSRRRAALTSRG